MYKIKCGFCKKENEFSKIKDGGKAKVIVCKYCGRSIVVAYKDQKYYEE